MFRKSGLRSKGTGAAGISFDHRGSSGAGDAPEPTRLRAGRRHALKRGWWDSEKRQKLLQHIKKSPRSVDTKRGNEYNTYRVRPKRSAIYEQVFSPIRGITALRTAGRLFLSDSDSYGLNVALKRSKQHHNQFYHTSHLLSDGVLTADCPWYYTCEYYNTYVYFCPYIENFPLYLLMKIGSKGRRPARRRVGSGASPAAELPLWSKLRKFLPSVDTERRNGYNTYRVRPKRSANI